MPEMDLRQIDVLVAEHVMHDCRHRHVQEITEPTERGYLTSTRCVDCGADISTTAMPPFSSEIAAAWQVVEKMRERGYRFEIVDYIWAERYRVLFFQPSAGLASKKASSHASAPLAICLAALKAVGVEVPEDA